jgi:hypothetical protein
MSKYDTLRQTFQTIRIVRCYDYGVMRCADCKREQVYRSMDKATGMTTDTRIRDLRIWAREDGWTQKTKQRRWVCPECSKETPS